MSSCALARPRPSLIVWAKKEEGTHPRARAETERRGHQYCRVFSLLLLSCSVLVPRALLSRLPRTPPPSPNHAFNLLRETRDLVAGPDASVSPARHPWCGRHPIPRGSRAPPPSSSPQPKHCKHCHTRSSDATPPRRELSPTYRPLQLDPPAPLASGLHPRDHPAPAALPRSHPCFGP